jgi:N-methylhydantoinase A
MQTYRIGVDIGGTFTDFALYDDQNLTVATHKRLTTPDDPARAVTGGIAHLCDTAGVPPASVGTVVHGTTLVTNAVIQRTGVPTAMLVTQGFRDLLDIGREQRYDLYDMRIRYPEPAVPRPLRFEVPERILYDGEAVLPITFDGIEGMLETAIKRDRIEAVAICFLHSYINDSHEKAAVCWLRQRFPHLAVSASAEILPSMREYERWTTTCLNACVQPLVSRYLARIEDGLRAAGCPAALLVMTSSGTTLTADIAQRFPIRLLESGPAAGALMSARHGRSLGLPQLLSFDMGGTTAKGCIVQHGRPLKRYSMEVARVHEFRKGSGLPVSIPVIDMIEIGAGGGSLAELDERGVIRVGPHSAGAAPGPACYGLGGTRPTLTDANLVLGYLGADSFLGGAMPIDAAAARAAIAGTIAAQLGVDAERAAWGIHEVINEDVARAFRVHASECGVDYRNCSMVAFGGSGPVHGARIARKLRIPRVICPAGAGVMSAFGLLSSPIGFEVARSKRVGLAGLSDAALREQFAALRQEAQQKLLLAGVLPEAASYLTQLDMRYAGQGYEVDVAISEQEAAVSVESVRAAFDAAYHAIFGASFPERPAEIVNWKAEAFGPVPGEGRDYTLREAATGGPVLKAERAAWNPDTSQMEIWPVIDRYALSPGDEIVGPALIEEREATFVVGPQDRMRVDAHLNLVVEIGEVAS